ncbi:MAG: hypothetical protein ABSH35_13225 [Isosphaeraceae bacterium]|jgi:hypothetical protein
MRRVLRFYLPSLLSVGLDYDCGDAAAMSFSVARLIDEREIPRRIGARSLELAEEQSDASAAEAIAGRLARVCRPRPVRKARALGQHPRPSERSFCEPALTAAGTPATPEDMT